MEKRRRGPLQQEMWIPHCELPQRSSHPFYRKLNELLEAAGFDDFVEQECAQYYSEVGRPSIGPGVYFRCLFIGYFEGITSERGIAWRAADSLALQEFLGKSLSESTPDHSSISRARRLLSLDTHKKVFAWVLSLLAKRGLIVGRRIGIDATTLEANAAMRSIVRRDDNSSYEEFLRQLAEESGIDSPSKEDLARLDKKRKNKASNKDWVNPNDPDARITKMKNGSTHLAHKAEHGVDMDTGAVISVTVQGADMGDTTTIHSTLAEAGEAVAELVGEGSLSEGAVGEVVADKGYHSGKALLKLKRAEVRTYIPEKRIHGSRNWKGKQEIQQAVYNNRRRVKGTYGKALLKKRGELVERSFAHCYETGGMRRLHLRKRDNILKRQLVHVGAFNLSLVMRKLLGYGTPRGFQGLRLASFSHFLVLFNAFLTLQAALWCELASEGGFDLKKCARPRGCRRKR